MSAVVLGDEILVTTPHAGEMKALGASHRGGAWRLPATMLNAHALIDAGLADATLKDGIKVPSGTIQHDRLFDYQRDAVARLLSAPRGQMMVIPPGLGKTAVAIVAADIAEPKDRIVVVAPASLLRTWEREILKWTTEPGDVYVMDGKPDYEAAHYARWIVVSWDRVARDPDVWKTDRGDAWPLWVLDESVLVKSRDSKRFKALTKIRPHVDRLWLLSASPTTKYSDDLWTQLNLIWPRAFRSYWRFTERYCVVEDNVWSGFKSVVGNVARRDVAAENSDLIHVVQPDVDLPDYLWEPPIAVTLGKKQRREYNRMRKDFVAELDSGPPVVAENEVSKLIRLQQIASYWDGESAKHDALMDNLYRFEPPYLIWVHWKPGSSVLQDRLRSAGVDAYLVDGDTRTSTRDVALKAFSDGEMECLLLSLGVGKFGHTFTKTKTIIYHDLTWAADDYFQSLHRVRRIGLEWSPVVVPIRAIDTTDEAVGDNLEVKLGGIAKMTRGDISMLLKGLGR